MIARWVVGVVLLFGILLLMLPRTDEVSLARIASASMLMCTQALREEVAQQLHEEEAVTLRFDNHCPDLIARLVLDESGEIVIIGNSHPLQMTLQPVVESGKVRWRCRGEPADRITSLCKP
jgi:hypothetical protein